MDTTFRLDRTTFRAVTYQEAECTKQYWLSRPVEERLRAAMYLNYVAYNYPLDNSGRVCNNFT
jgi:hypothetical protein